MRMFGRRGGERAGGTTSALTVPNEVRRDAATVVATATAPERTGLTTKAQTILRASDRLPGRTYTRLDDTHYRITYPSAAGYMTDITIFDPTHKIK